MYTSVRYFLSCLVLAVAATSSVGIGAQAAYSVVINEIHYDPDIKTELVEFVELYNAGTMDVELGGWYLTGGISYEFPTGSTLSVGGHIIVAQDPAFIDAKWSSGRAGVPPSLVFGPFEGKLGNDGENIRLCDASGERLDEVDYQLGFPWPTVGDAVPEDRPGTGNSIQLVNPFVDNDLSGQLAFGISHAGGIQRDGIPRQHTAPHSPG